MPKMYAMLIVTLIGMTFLSTRVWQLLVTDTLYHCTDAMWLDFLNPGSWVHDPVVLVAQVLPSSSMSEPDTIRVGWSMSSLWNLWYSFVGVSVAVSILSARASWSSSPRTEEDQQTHAS